MTTRAGPGSGTGGGRPRCPHSRGGGRGGGAVGRAPADGHPDRPSSTPGTTAHPATGTAHPGSTAGRAESGTEAGSADAGTAEAGAAEAPSGSATRGESPSALSGTGANGGAEAAGSPDAWQYLRLARELTEPGLRKSLDRLPEPVRTAARYHFGWLDTEGNPADGTWGKGLRPALVLASAQVVGNSSDQATAAAVSVELVHNFSLVHDDLMDNDATRRGRPSVWSLHGSAQAVLTGDALLVLAIAEIAAQEPALSSAAVRELTGVLLELVGGQGADLAFEHRYDVGLDECLRMSAGKTAALLAGACALGGLSAGAGAEQVGALRRFGHHLGLAFQIVDDVLGIWGDTTAFGKPVGADITARKKSFPVVAALSSGTPSGRQLAQLYRGAEPLTNAQVHRAARLIEEAGGRKSAVERATAECATARDHLYAAVPSGGAGARALLALSDLVTDRHL